MQDILLLHGAIGFTGQLYLLEQKLADLFTVHSLNFSGHGGFPDTNEFFSIALFAAEVITFLDEKEIDSINIFGYSMGGYVAIYLAKHHPQRIKKIITLATKFTWDETIAAQEIKMLNAAKIEEKLPDFAAVLQKRHAPNDWKAILEKTAAMLIQMGEDNPLKTADYPSIHHFVLLMLGDRDKMVTLDETINVYKLLPKAQLAILPNTAHPIEMVNEDRLAFEIRSFWNKISQFVTNSQPEILSRYQKTAEIYCQSQNRPFFSPQIPDILLPSPSCFKNGIINKHLNADAQEG